MPTFFSSFDIMEYYPCLLFGLLYERFKAEVSEQVISRLILAMSRAEKLFFLQDCFSWAPDHFLNEFVSLAEHEKVLDRLLTARLQSDIPSCLVSQAIALMSTEDKLQLLKSAFTNPLTDSSVVEALVLLAENTSIDIPFPE